jgi:hypothetical protein
VRLHEPVPLHPDLKKLARTPPRESRRRLRGGAGRPAGVASAPGRHVRQQVTASSGEVARGARDILVHFREEGEECPRPASRQRNQPNPSKTQNNSSRA